MNMPISNGNLYNIVHVVFASFYPTILFMKGPQWKCSYTALLCYPYHRILYRVYYGSGRKSSVNNINLYESNVGQIFELSFCDCER